MRCEVSCEVSFGVNRGVPCRCFVVASGNLLIILSLVRFPLPVVLIAGITAIYCSRLRLFACNLNCCWLVEPQPAYCSLLQCHSPNCLMLGGLPSALMTSALTPRSARVCGDLWTKHAGVRVTTHVSPRSGKTSWKGIGLHHRPKCEGEVKC